MFFSKASPIIKRKKIVLFCPGSLNFGDNAILFSWLNFFDKQLSAEDEVYILGCEVGYIECFLPRFHFRCYCSDKVHRLIWDSNISEENEKNFLNHCLNQNRQGNISDELISLEPGLFFAHDLVKKCSYVHFLGGGYINSLWMDVQTQTKLIMGLAKLYGKKIVMTGQTIGPLLPKQKEVLAYQLSFVDLMDLRDESELKYLSQVNTDVHVTVDDVLLDDTYYSECCDPILAELARYPHINLCIQNWKGVTETEYSNLYLSIASFLEHRLSEEPELRLYILEMMPQDDDKNWGRRVANLLNEEYRSRVVEIRLPNFYPLDAVHLIQSAKLNIGTRYHLALFSLCSLKSKPITISLVLDEYYKRKIERIHELYSSKSYLMVQDCSKDKLEELYFRGSIPVSVEKKEYIQKAKNEKIRLYKEILDGTSKKTVKSSVESPKRFDLHSSVQTDSIIQVNNISMRFNLAKEHTDTIKEYILKMLKHQILFQEFYALKNVSFTVNRGDSVAIIGSNGSGKSTLLKCIAGIMRPTNGEIIVQGDIAPLIELGAGFDPDLTARENIYLNGAVLGHDRKFMDEHFKRIVDFAELWDFIDVPVKNFSSGMVARLGFSIATEVQAEILVVDEILSVGDYQFQEKCKVRMTEMMKRGTTLLFVSHSEQQVKELCNKAIWLDKGSVVMFGESHSVVNAYRMPKGVL